MIRYTKKEEIWNAASHGGGILMGVVFGIMGAVGRDPLPLRYVGLVRGLDAIPLDEAPLEVEGTSA